MPLIADDRPKTARQIIDEQADDPRLWGRAMTPMESALQEALRRLHTAVEGEAPVTAGVWHVHTFGSYNPIERVYTCSGCGLILTDSAIANHDDH